MLNTMIRTGAALGVASAVALYAGQSTASTFVAWKIQNVEWGDTLNIRKYPSSTSQKQAAYPNGTVLQMTGKCTGSINLKEIAGLSRAKQERLVRYSWCQVWHDPKQNGDYVSGWVYGKYITPY